MGKFDRFETRQAEKTRQAPQVHPIWRGIGCLMLIIIPIMAYAAADVFYADAPGFSVFGMPVLPRSGDIYDIIFYFPITDGIAFRLSLFHIIFALLFSVIAFLIFSFIYSLVYRLAGPPKYGPTDAPPPKRRKKRRR